MPQATAATFQTTVEQYTQDVCQMKSYVTAIIQTQLPNLSGFEILDPNDYNQLVQAYSAMVTSATGWNNGPQIALENLVGSLTETSALVNDQLINAVAAAELLQSNPADAQALQSFNQTLVSLQNVIEGLSGNVQEAATDVKNQEGIITNNTLDLNNAQTDIANLLSAAKVDITNLQNSINNMNQTISSLQNDIVATEYIEAGGGVLMLIGFALAVTLNPLSFLVFFGGVVAASIEVDRRTLDQQALASIQTQVTNLQNELNNDTAALAVAQSAAITANNLATQLNAILQGGSPIQQIENFVGTVLADLQGIQQTAQKAQTDEGNWAQVIIDLTSAQSEWKAIQQIIGNAGNFSISFTPAQATVIQAAA